MENIPIHIAIEDILSEAVVRRILKRSPVNFCIGNTYNQGGNVKLKRKIGGYLHAAQKGTPFFVLTDLDSDECCPAKRQEWLAGLIYHPNLIFRIASRTVEAWLLADRKRFANFLGVSETKLPLDPDLIPYPKRVVLDLARKSRWRYIKEDIVPRGTASQGQNYNDRLIEFVLSQWNVKEASQSSDSLKRAIRQVDSFTWICGDND